MIDAVTRIKEYISLTRQGARFVACAHSSESTDPITDLGDGYYLVSLYDTKIASNVLETPVGLVIVDNSYLSSFANNLMTCWFVCATKHTGLDLPGLLKHNFKKFFAEQLLSKANRRISRALFLETLLYEQKQMAPVFAAKAATPELARLADVSAEIISSLVRFHELGHYFFKKHPNRWHEVFEPFGDVVRPFVEQVKRTRTARISEEFECDVVAIIGCLTQFEGMIGTEFCLRAVVFGFASFSGLFSLTKSAAETASMENRVVECIDFESIQKSHFDYRFNLLLDEDFIERALLAIELCCRLADRQGVKIWETGGAFPLQPSLLSDLLKAVGNIVESEDANARETALLVATALHDHPQGLDFLFLRSRTFRFGSDREADGTHKIR